MPPKSAKKSPTWEPGPPDELATHSILTTKPNVSWHLAQVWLGAMYEKGTAVTQDSMTAHMWFNIAAANGYYSYSADGESDRNRLAKSLPPSQLIEAQQNAKRCM